MKKLAFTLILAYSFNLSGQTLKNGDSSIVEDIKEITSSIYENKDNTFFLLTRGQLQTIKTYGTSIIAHQKDKLINRLIAISMTSDGQLSTEFYFDNQQLVYVYQTFEYFDEVKNAEGWKNFKGLYGWESRYYFAPDGKSFQKHVGKHQLATSGEIKDLKKDANTILRYVLGKK